MDKNTKDDQADQEKASRIREARDMTGFLLVAFTVQAALTIASIISRFRKK